MSPLNQYYKERVIFWKNKYDNTPWYKFKTKKRYFNLYVLAVGFIIDGIK